MSLYIWFLTSPAQPWESYIPRTDSSAADPSLHVLFREALATAKEP